MKIVDNNRIHAKSGRSVQHRIEDKSGLSHRTNSDGLEKKTEQKIQSAPSETAPKADNPAIPEHVIRQRNVARTIQNREIHQRNVSVKTDGKHRIVGMQAESSRTIQKRVVKVNAPKKAVKRDLSKLHFQRMNPFKHKKFRVTLKKSKDKSVKIPTGKSSGVSVPKGGGGGGIGGGAPLNIAKNVITKPVTMAGDKLLSQRADLSKTEDTGAESLKLGLQTVDYARRGARTIKSAAQAPRKIYKGVKRTVNNTKRAVKATAKAARNAAKAAKASAKAAAKTAKATAKAVVQATGKVISLIAETMPYSAIVIAVIIVVLLLMYLVNSLIGAAGSAVGGIGGWAANSNTSSEKDVYDNINEYISDIKSALKTDTLNSLKNTVDDFCALRYCEGCRTDENGNKYCDGHVKENIIEFKSDKISVSYYPAHNGQSALDGYIDNFANQFDNEFYADFLAALYVLKARKMQNSGNSNVTIFDLEITDSDIAEMIKSVNTNSGDFGQTYFYKTTESTTGKCPGENCRTEYRNDGCSTDENGNKTCGGHPYCPGTHEKLIVKLYSTEKYTGKKPEQIYGFSDDEKAQYTAVKEFIKAIKNDIESG